MNPETEIKNLQTRLVNEIRDRIYGYKIQETEKINYQVNRLSQKLNMSTRLTEDYIIEKHRSGTNFNDLMLQHGIA